MNKAIKWILMVGGGLIVLVIAALLIIPMFVDVQKYKPELEKRVAEATGRPFTLGGDLSLSLFPWAGVSLSDLHLGNPPGFQEKDFLFVKSFEVRVKLLPLISKEIQVKRFILEGTRIVLERRKDGRGNWEGLGKPSKEKEKLPEKKPSEGLPIKALAVGEVAITDGSALWIDHVKGERREISDVALRLDDVSLDRPVHLTLSAQLDGKPLSLEGDLGPLGKDPGKGIIPLDLSIKALKQLDMRLKGKLTELVSRKQFDLELNVSPFSPRELLASLGQKFPVSTADPKALTRVALKAKLKGDPENISVSDGALDLDESKLTFTVKAKDFSRPDVAFDLNLDTIDLDRYLPPPSKKKADEEKKKAEAPKPDRKKMDYTPLRRLILDGAIRVGKLKARDVKIQDLSMKVTGKDGLFNLDPLALNLYKGGMSVRGAFDVRKDVPKINMELQAKGIQSGSLLKDLLKKDFLEGTAQSRVAISMVGDDAEKIKSTLNGNGDFLFKDGAIVGIDLAGMIRNIKSIFGLAEKDKKKPRTDFSELHSPFTITNGVVNTSNTSMSSPLLRVLAAGKADLVKEDLDFRVEPTFVATIKGQDDTKQRSGITVPVLVTGSFNSPKFCPDLKGMVKNALGDPSKLKEILKGPGKETGESAPKEEKLKGLLKSLPFKR